MRITLLRLNKRGVHVPGLGTNIGVVDGKSHPGVVLTLNECGYVMGFYKGTNFAIGPTLVESFQFELSEEDVQEAI